MPEQPGANPTITADHWLVRIVRRAGLVEDQALDVAPATGVREAWRTVARALDLDDARLARLVAEYFRLQVADLSRADPSLAAVIPEELARRHHVVPLAGSNRQLVVATSDPTDMEAERVLAFTTGRAVVFQVAPPDAIGRLLDDEHVPSAGSLGRLLGSLDVESEELESVKAVEDWAPESVSEDDAQATPVIKLTNLIIREGVQSGASDIHIEPGRQQGAVRYRVDGVLRKHMDLPMNAVNRIISRVKILAKLDIADRLRPQDGKARVKVGDSAYDLRVSTMAAAGSEKCVIRILDSSPSVTLDMLNLPVPELERLRQLLSHRDGIVVVTGPTGSGKTTTLYGALRELADGKVNIMTVEDPIEYELPAVTQTQVEVKQGFTFATALRAILRQDPDVILVGEIRDRETAVIASQAAMTGHLVLATVHANDAASSVARLADVGLHFATIANTLRGGMAQRLLRSVCDQCAEVLVGDLTPEEAKLTERHGVRPTVRAVGCYRCGFTGYRGRIPVVEVMVVGPRIVEAIEHRKGTATLQRLAIQGGMRTMHQVGLDWVTAGRTTLQEVERVLGGAAELEDEQAAEGPSRVLLVDDDAEARLMMRTLLAQDGLVVEEAEDGEAALEFLARDPDFSLVVLDLTMPRMDGREALKRIRGSVDTMAIPILIRTASGSDEAETELLEAGADDFVSKSADAARFMARVRAVLRRSLL